MRCHGEALLVLHLTLPRGVRLQLMPVLKRGGPLTAARRA
jgi:hypothetical protein